MDFRASRARFPSRSVRSLQADGLVGYNSRSWRFDVALVASALTGRGLVAGDKGVESSLAG